MRTRLLIAIALISLGLVSCMKKTRIGRLNSGNTAEVLPDYGNPATPSAECPNGVGLTLTPPSNANYRVNETSTFNVTASGCKYGYRLSYDNENRNFGDSTTVLAAASFPKTFTAAGRAVVSARVSVLNLNQQPVREFPISISVIVNEALPLVCPSANIMIPRSVSGDYDYAFNLQPSRPSIITGITGSASDFISASPTLSTTPSQSIQGNIVVKGRNGTLSFAIKDANNVTATCSVIIRKDIFGVTLDFNGDRILDDATLVRLSDGTYQLQISYTQFVGATKINSIIPATGFLATEFYEWMTAGDLNGDSRPDLIFFRREGNPAVGKLKIARSRGGTVGGADLAYDFSDLSGQWASDRLLQFAWLDAEASPPRIVGNIGNQFYTSRIENTMVSNPEPLTYSMSLTATLRDPLVGGGSMVTLTSQGLGHCSVISCGPLDSNNRCISSISQVLGDVKSNYQSNVSNYVINRPEKSLVAASCDLGRQPPVTYQEVVIPASVPPPPPAPPTPPLPAHCLAGEVSGGEVVDQGPYRIHKFRNIGVTPLTLNRNCAVDLLVVGGGGGGGVGRASGGGGAGGLIHQSGYRFSSAGTYQVTVGSGGAANANGGNSSVSNLVVALGGGKGGGGQGQSNQGGTGGSGGGAGFKNNCSVGAGTSGQGNAGGCARSGNWIAGGGGGGAAGAGTAGGCSGASVGTVCGGNGGAGLSLDISGVSATYAGGGGGNGQGVGGAAGAGGGGRGGVNGGAGANGVANTGGGGGAASGAGGSGVVILRYLRQVTR